MGKLLSSYKKALLLDFIDALEANTARYYAFASNPIPNDGDIPAGGKQTTYDSAKKALLDHVVFTELNKVLLL